MIVMCFTTMVQVQTVQAYPADKCNHLVNQYKRMNATGRAPHAPNVGTLIRHNTGWSTNNTITLTYSWLRTMCVEATNVYVFVGTVYTSRRGQMASDLAVMTDCLPRAGMCDRNDSVIVWDPAELDVRCPYAVQGNYMATVRGSQLMIDELQVCLQYQLYLCSIQNHITRTHFRAHTR
jgi:hypothetical protein